MGRARQGAEAVSRQHQQRAAHVRGERLPFVEGVPDRDSYYLIGLRIKSGDAYVQYSFWANELSEEKDIWAAFLQTLAQIELWTDAQNKTAAVDSFRVTR